jgi:hypothetical protein
VERICFGHPSNYRQLTSFATVQPLPLAQPLSEHRSRRPGPKTRAARDYQSGSVEWPLGCIQTTWGRVRLADNPNLLVELGARVFDLADIPQGKSVTRSNSSVVRHQARAAGSGKRDEEGTQGLDGWDGLIDSHYPRFFLHRRFNRAAPRG